MVEAYAWRADGIACEAVLPYEEIDSPEWQTVHVGLLDVVVCGLRGGEVLCMPRLDMARVAETARARTWQFDVLSAAGAMAKARENRPPVCAPREVGMPRVEWTMVRAACMLVYGCLCMCWWGMGVSGECTCTAE